VSDRRAGAAPEPVALHHEDLGSGPPLLFLHGWGMSLEVWERQVHDEAARHRVVCADLRGHGASPKPYRGYGYDEHCADVLDLLARLDLDDVALIGWSMAGSLGARVARASGRISRLVLVGSPPRLTRSDGYPEGADPTDCLTFRERIATNRQAAMWQTAVDTLHREDAEPMRRWLHQLTMRAPLWALLGCYDGVIDADVREDLRALTIPTLVVHGRHDAYVTTGAANWVATNVEGARLELLEHSGHAPFLDEPERFGAILEDFLR
jgi:pimeloyl-ACP methyl ester carboxylesterase